MRSVVRAARRGAVLASTETSSPDFSVVERLNNLVARKIDRLRHRSRDHLRKLMEEAFDSECPAARVKKYFRDIQVNLAAAGRVRGTNEYEESHL